MEVTVSSKPSEVHRAIALLWLSLGIEVVYQAVMMAQSNANTLAGSLTTIVIMFALRAYLVVGVAKGRSSARLILVGLFVIGLTLVGPILPDFSQAPFDATLQVIQLLLQIFAFYLLFTRRANGWFRLRKSHV